MSGKVLNLACVKIMGLLKVIYTLSYPKNMTERPSASTRDDIVPLAVNKLDKTTFSKFQLGQAAGIR
jgi:hypothetical protein